MDQKEIKALISLIDDKDANISSHITHKIISLGDNIVPFLKEEQSINIDPYTKGKIGDIIHTISLESTYNRILEWKEFHEEDLLHGCWAVATYQYPALTLEELQNTMDRCHELTKGSFKKSHTPTENIKALNNIFFSMMKFEANKNNFHSSSNSFINDVLSTKKGNPLSLSILYLLLAKKLDLPVYGINLPNLFILSYLSDSLQFYINVFNRGLIFTKKDIDNYLSQLNVQASKRFYDPCTNTDMVIRQLKNLIVSFEANKEPHKRKEIEFFLTILEK